MQSKTIKQIIICFVIFVGVGVLALFAKSYFFEEEKNFSSDVVIKEKYEYNEFQLANVTNEIIIRRYFVDFKDKLLNHTEEAYSLLDNETKKEYPTYNDFKNYISNNINDLRFADIMKYDVQKKGSTTHYVVIDQFDNKYTFMSKAVLLYTVNIGLYNENSSIFE
ncbi:MAG: hypothetical protein IJO43_01320 [Bacilli bacterium]|nr:hypothetical protein [Bacilli bacterium]